LSVNVICYWTIRLNHHSYQISSHGIKIRLRVSKIVTEGRMSLVGRSVWLGFMFIVLLSCVKNSVGTKRVIWIGNTLVPQHDLSLACTIGSVPYLITPGNHLEWDNYDDKDKLECTFHWHHESHNFHMYDSSRDGNCNPCKWIIKENGPCRFNGTFACYRWEV